MSGSILIVDDDKAHLSMLETIFTGWGFKTTGVEDGANAIEEVQGTVSMPNMWHC